MSTSNISMTPQDALAYLISWLKKPEFIGNCSTRPFHDYNLKDVVAHYLKGELGFDIGSRPDAEMIDCYVLFLEAAWHLSRMGIIRNTMKSYPIGDVHASEIGGLGITITEMGREWLKREHAAFSYIPSDPTRFTLLIEPYRGLFGEGFFQRASEAGTCWAHGTYYAACAMAGAAAESIMLAIAIKKEGDEDKIIKEYSKGSGRTAIERKITASMKEREKRDFESYIELLKYWRDNAAHGRALSFTEFEAHDALSRLLRFSQFSKNRWLNF